MKALQRPALSFDARSVMLFAALSLGGVGVMHAHAETTTKPSPTFGPAAKTAPAASSTYSIGPAPARAATAASAAFERADTNKDGQLTAQESKQLPAISQRFKELDTDKNGSLSHAEFEKGANS